MKLLSFCILSVFIISCQTVTINPKGGWQKYSSFPSYEVAQSFFFWGLAGEAYIDVSSICGEREVRQMQRQATFTNQLLTLITLGIYSPRTARVWCGNRKPQKRPDEKINEETKQ